MSRGLVRALQGQALSVGAPLGWFIIQVAQGRDPGAELAANWGLYLYMMIATMLVFGIFGMVLGGREERLEEMAISDGLTGLRNARYFHARILEEHAESERTGEPLAVVMLDLDHFKAVNDTYGHLVGDDVLAATGRAINQGARRGETAARVGGEEFAVILPGTSASEAYDAAERLREAIAAIRIPTASGVLTVRASAGVASTADHPGVSAHELLNLSDAALYRAKQEGRDRTVAAAGAHAEA